ncbi:hypothetical protein DSECCO2_85170 [anaerobic digester metagenome]
MKQVAVLQPNYIPWKGYFDIINDVDTFIFYDDVQYTKNDWRNRNIILGPTGQFWLTIPISKSSVNHNINKVQIENSHWQKKHLTALKSCYSKSQYFNNYLEIIKCIYEDNAWTNLSTLNEYWIEIISKILKINVKFLRSSDFILNGNKNERLLDLLHQVGADEYISGPSGKGYLNEKQFIEEGINLVYKDYSYPEYNQLWDKGFNHYVSVLDLIFNKGPDSPYYIWGWRDGQRS